MAHLLDTYRDRIVELAHKKLSAAKIAAELGLSDARNTIIGYCYRNGIQLGVMNGMRKNNAAPIFAKLDEHRDEIVSRIEKAHNKARTIQILAAKFASSNTTIRAWMRNRGLTPQHDPLAPIKTRRPTVDFAPPPVEGVPFLDAGPDQCRYPLWGLAEKIGNVCGKPVVEKIVQDKVTRLSWCPDCLRRVTAPRRAEAA